MSEISENTFPLHFHFPLQRNRIRRAIISIIQQPVEPIFLWSLWYPVNQRYIVTTGQTKTYNQNRFWDMFLIYGKDKRIENASVISQALVEWFFYLKLLKISFQFPRFVFFGKTVRKFNFTTDSCRIKHPVNKRYCRLTASTSTLKKTNVNFIELHFKTPKATLQWCIWFGVWSSKYIKCSKTSAILLVLTDI